MRSAELAPLLLLLAACGSRTELRHERVVILSGDAAVDAIGDGPSDGAVDGGADAEAAVDAVADAPKEASVGRCPVAMPTEGAACPDPGPIPYLCAYVPSAMGGMPFVFGCGADGAWKADLGPTFATCPDFICDPQPGIGTLVECVVGDGVQCCLCNPADQNRTDQCGPC